MSNVMFKDCTSNGSFTLYHCNCNINHKKVISFTGHLIPKYSSVNIPTRCTASPSNYFNQGVWQLEPFPCLTYFSQIPLLITSIILSRDIQTRIGLVITRTTLTTLFFLLGEWKFYHHEPLYLPLHWHKCPKYFNVLACLSPNVN